MGRASLILVVAIAVVAMAACEDGGSPGPNVAGTVEPTGSLPTPTPTAEPIPLPPEVRSVVAGLGWDGFLRGEIEFSFDNPRGGPFSVECFSESTTSSVGELMMSAEGSGALDFSRDYVEELAATSNDLIETLNCVPDNGLPEVVVSMRVHGPDGLIEQLQRQPPVSDAGLAFVALRPQDGRLILSARLSAAGEPGTLDCSGTPSSASTTYVFGDVKPFSAEDTVVEFLLPDLEEGLEHTAPGDDLAILCNLYGPDETEPRDSRTLRLTPPFN